MFKNIGFAITGSFCTHEKILVEVKNLADKGYNVIPIFSQSVSSTDTRFGTAKDFYDKHIMPRRIRAALKLVCQQDGLTPKAILDAANDANPLDEASWLAAVYADLSAISLTVSKRLLPWYGREDSYPFPDYIKEILDENMEVDPVKLNQELNRLQPYVNV